MSEHSLSGTLDAIYEAMEGSDAALSYSARHGIVSQAVLTVINDETADLIAEHLSSRIEGKIVVEIGGGIGLLACHLGHHAKRVWCIEANPMWSWAFTVTLLQSKPKNVSFLFGAADEFAGTLKADVALFCTHSGVDAMRATAAMFAPEIIDVYGEIIAADPKKFDALAVALRPIA